MNKDKLFTVGRYTIGGLPYIFIMFLLTYLDSGRSSISTIVGNNYSLTLFDRSYNLLHSIPLDLGLEVIGACFLWYVFCKLLKYSFVIINCY